MTRTILTTLAAALIAAIGFTVLTPVAADAATGRSNCVTKKEFRKIKHGQSYAKVKRITHAKGTVTAESYIGYGYGTWKSREFKVCKPYSKYSFVSVDFQKGKVDGKYAFWLHN